MNPRFDQLPSQAAASGQGLGLGSGSRGGKVPRAYATAVSRAGGLTAAAFTTAGLKGHVQDEVERRSRPTSRAPSPRPLPPQEDDGGWEEEGGGGWEGDAWGSDNDAYDDSDDDDTDDDDEDDDDDDENDEDHGSEVGNGNGNGSKAGAKGGGTLTTRVSVDDSQALYWHGPTHPLTIIKVPHTPSQHHAQHTLSILWLLSYGWLSSAHPLQNERRRGRAGRTIDIQRVTAKVLGASHNTHSQYSPYHS